MWYKEMLRRVLKQSVTTSAEATATRELEVTLESKTKKGNPGRRSKRA